MILAFPYLEAQMLLADPGSEAPLAGRLVFFGHREGDEEPHVARIISMQPDGSDQRLELKFDRPIHGGRVAPDGRTLAFNARTSEPVDGVIRSAGLWVREPGQEARMVAEDAWLCGWHPSGKELLAYRMSGERYENFGINVQTGEVRPLELPDGSAVQTWSPDGRTLVVIAMNPQRTHDDPTRGKYPLRQLYLWDVESKQQQLFTDPEHDCIWPAYAPDGKQIAYYLRRHTDRPWAFLAVADSDGANGRELAPADDVTEQIKIRPTGFPRWSPDGKEIAWLRTVDHRPAGELTFEVFFVSSDGRLTRRLPLDERYSWGHFDWVH